jgi:hypothetical protein
LTWYFFSMCHWGKYIIPEFQDGTDEIMNYLVGMEESSMGWYLS